MLSPRLRSSPTRPRRSAPRLEMLESRQLLTVNFNQNLDVLTITGDRRNNTVAVSDTGTNANNNISVTGDGATFTSGSHVREIIINTQNGNDNVTYNLSNLIAGSPRKITLTAGSGNDRFALTTGNLNSSLDLSSDMGSGNDTATVNVNGDIASPSELLPITVVNLKVDGGSGNDTTNITTQGAVRGAQVSVNATGSSGNDRIAVALNSDLIPASGFLVPQRLASATVTADGGSGNDTITLTHNGIVRNATLGLTANGGSENDRITVNHTGDTDSVVGILASPSLSLTADGGTGNDTIVSSVQGGLNFGATLTANLTGGTGNDRITYSQSGNISATSRASWAIDAGSGNDTVNATYDGVLNGRLLLTADGGPGNDTVAVNVNAGAGSTGQVGAAGNTATVRGSAGNDMLTFAVRRNGFPNTLSSTAVVIGDAGRDTSRRTFATVNGDPSNETDISIV
jgi:Ca2+-binding RTX toxin-like protein